MGIPRRGLHGTGAKPDPYFTTKVYHYPNDQEATSLWYHDHSLGIVRLNVFSGLA